MSDKTDYTIFFEEQSLTCSGEQSVLEALESKGLTLSSSCRAGQCQSCLLSCKNKKLPERTQQGLTESQKAVGGFLPCVCPVVDGMEITREASSLFIDAQISRIEKLAEEVLRLTVSCKDYLPYRAGQFVSIQREDGLIRQYSIAGVNSDSSELEFHVSLIPDGKMSGWLQESAQSGIPLKLSEPAGSCVYYKEIRDRDLILLGTGTGLAPLYGVLLEALQSEHEGAIYLFHGSSYQQGLYLVEELLELERKYPGFHYYPCVSREEVQPPYHASRADQVALETVTDWQDKALYLCGNPQMVKQVKKQFFLKGIPSKFIFADSFLPAGTPISKH